MFMLDSGNVLMKPAQRKQFMTSLRRSLRLGDRLDDFRLSVDMWRKGRAYEMHARVHDRAGDFDCKSRKRDWDSAVKDLQRQINSHVHGRCLGRQVA